MRNRTLYYLSPFAVMPLVCLLSVGIAAILSAAGLISVMKYVFPVLLLLTAVGIARRTGTRLPVDWLIALLIPLSFFLTMFFANFFDQGETYARFDAIRALRAVMRREYLWMYLSLAAASLVVSYKRCRIKRLQNA